ncbi:unnamed protein product [Arctogadus glacialis]
MLKLQSASQPRRRHQTSVSKMLLHLSLPEYLRWHQRLRVAHHFFLPLPLLLLQQHQHRGSQSHCALKRLAGLGFYQSHSSGSSSQVQVHVSEVPSQVLEAEEEPDDTISMTDHTGYLVGLNRTITALSLKEEVDIVQQYTALHVMDKKHSSYTQKARKKGKASGGPWRAPRRPSGSAPGQQAAERSLRTMRVRQKSASDTVPGHLYHVPFHTQAPPEHSQEYSSAHQLPPAHTQGWSTYQAPLAHSHVWSSTQPPPSASNQGWSATHPPTTLSILPGLVCHPIATLSILPGLAFHPPTTLSILPGLVIHLLLS